MTLQACWSKRTTLSSLFMSTRPLVPAKNRPSMPDSGRNSVKGSKRGSDDVRGCV